MINEHIKLYRAIKAFSFDMLAAPQIAQLLRCFICLGSLQKPVLCPHCSKLCCSDCITVCLGTSTWMRSVPKTWLEKASENSNEGHCPHCRRPLTKEQLVAARFMEDLQAVRFERWMHIELVLFLGIGIATYHCTSDQPPLEETCKVHHHLPLEYWCHDCDTPICSDCAVFDRKVSLLIYWRSIP